MGRHIQSHFLGETGSVLLLQATTLLSIGVRFVFIDHVHQIVVIGKAVNG